MDPWPEVMTLQQAADYLQVHWQTLRRYAKRGAVPAAKVGRAWRFHKADIDAWLRRQHRTPQLGFEQSEEQ